MATSQTPFIVRFLISSIVLLEVVCTTKAFDQTEQSKAEAFLDYYNTTVLKKSYNNVVVSWSYSTNLTEYNRQVKINSSLEYGLFYSEVLKNASIFNLTKLKDDTARQLKLLTATAALKNTSERAEVEVLGSKMESIYSTAKVGQDSLNPELSNIMAKSRNYSELLRAWWGWRNVSGRNIRQSYKEFVALTNKGAKENGFKDRGEWWRSWYEVEDLPGNVENLWNDLKPLYLELHAYVRHKLRKTYPTKVSADGYIEAHLLGNMWAQTWVNIYDLIEPYKNKSSLDVTSNLKKDTRYNTPTNLTKLAESFFTSLGLEKLPPGFYEKSLLEKPKDRDVVCHASAWDFQLYRDFRIKQCIQIAHNDLVTIHHELGHIQYYLQYWKLPEPYRTGANPGFHEAVGDLMSLSVDTPTHLEKLGLLKNYVSDEESDINALMKMALRKIAFLPFGYLIDQWRWKVFSGAIKDTEYNKKWWELRQNYQGIKAPVPRTEDDFDPGAKYHIPADTPYIRYFVSYVLQFQFHKAACEAAKFKGPLFKCSIYNSKEAGAKIAAMLSMGKSKPWPFALEKMTDTQNMSVAPLKEYFQPLQEWLVKERCSKGYKIGWPGQPGADSERCSGTTKPNTSSPTKPNTSSPTKPNHANTSNHFTWLLLVLVIPVSFFVN